jgi:hypothetical protein
VTISKGSGWGNPGGLAPDSRVVSSDAELRAVVSVQLSAGAPPEPIGLTGGDLHRTIGSPATERMWGPDARQYPIDVIEVVLDDRPPSWFVAHLVAGRGPMWLTPTLVAMNGSFLGPANLGPKSHPGDGLIDVTSGRVPLNDYWGLRSRLGVGTHLPHAGLVTSRVSSLDVSFRRAVSVRLDGVRAGRARQIRCRVLPDAAVIVA